MATKLRGIATLIEFKKAEMLKSKTIDNKFLESIFTTYLPSVIEEQKNKTASTEIDNVINVIADYFNTTVNLVQK